MLCIGNSIAVLAAGRVLQGFSAAVVWVVGLALIVDTVGPDDIGQAMGYVGLSMSLAILLAPLLGGVVFAAAGYYSVFAMAFGLIVLDIILRLFMIEKKIAARWLTVEEVNETKGAIRAKAMNKTEVDVGDDIEMAVTSPTDRATEGPVVAVEVNPTPATFGPKKLADRMPPIIYLLSSRRVLSALWACLVQASLMTAFDTILPLFVRDTFHWNSLGAGLIFLPLVIVSFIGPVVGWASDKYGPRWLATAGFIINMPCLVLLRLVHENTMGQKVLLCALLACIGLTLSLVLT